MIKKRLIVTYKIVTGQNYGTYLRIQPFQKSKDYDKDKSKELKYWNDNVSEYVERSGGQQRWVRMPWGDVNTDCNPKKYITQHSYIIKPGKGRDFRRWLERIGKIMSERRPEMARVVLGIISGGNWQEFVVFNAFNKYEAKLKEFDSFFGTKNIIKDLVQILGMRIEKISKGQLICYSATKYKH